MLIISGPSIQKILKEVIKEAFPSKIFPGFAVRVEAREYVSKDGDYDEIKKEICIYNLSRRSSTILRSALFFLSQHCETALYGKTALAKPFYLVYKHLLEAAHRLRHIDLTRVYEDTDLRDIRVLEKHWGSLSFERYPPSSDVVIKTGNAYLHKEKLTINGYEFSPTEKIFVKRVVESVVEKEIAWLQVHVPAVKYHVIPYDDYEVLSVYYMVLSSKTQIPPQTLTREGFFQSDRHGWVKKIAACEKVVEERNFARKYGEKPKFTGNLQQFQK